MKAKAKVGDLVMFYSSFEPFRRGYDHRNPGVVLAITEKGGWGSAQTSAEVLWCNEERTAEHIAYLEIVSESKNE